MDKPLLSVCIITYNHEKFIREAIEGVLMQKVNFNYEIIIADDYSTDNTRNIILEYVQSFPNLFKLIFQENNVGAAKNWIDLISTPESDYIAYFEGDDCWTDPYKLQKQVDILESDNSLIGCFHNVEVRYENGFKQSHAQISLTDRVRYNKFDISKNNVIPTLSIMFRNIAIPELYSKEFLTLSFGDWPLFLLLLRNGDFYYIPNIMGVRLINKGGIWSAKSNVENLIQIENTILDLVKYKWFDEEVNYFLLCELKRLKRQIRVKGKFRSLVLMILKKIYKAVGFLIERVK